MMISYPPKSCQHQSMGTHIMIDSSLPYLSEPEVQHGEEDFRHDSAEDDEYIPLIDVDGGDESRDVESADDKMQIVSKLRKPRKTAGGKKGRADVAAARKKSDVAAMDVGGKRCKESISELFIFSCRPVLFYYHHNLYFLAAQLLRRRRVLDSVV